MSDRDWHALVIRYADGRTPCNCGLAYYSTDRMCQYGCSANQISARNEIARRVVAELPTATVASPE